MPDRDHSNVLVMDAVQDIAITLLVLSRNGGCCRWPSTDLAHDLIEETVPEITLFVLQEIAFLSILVT